jgi:hypothetical protein
MAKNTITLVADTPRVFPLNHRAYDNIVSIQNQTGAELTVKVTNDNVQRVASGSVVWSDPEAGALAIADGSVGKVNGPHTALQLESTSGGAVKIVEQY